MSKTGFVMVGLAFLQIFVSSGIVLGWQSLANVIKSSGTYRFLCDDPSLPCIKEEVYLANLMSVIVSVQLSCVLFMGLLIDIIGPKFIGFLQCFSAMGTFMVAYGNPRGKIDYIWYGAIMQNMCGSVYVPSFIYLANLFPKWKGLITSVFSTSYGLSSSVFLLVQFAYDNFSLSRSSALLPLGVIQSLFVVYGFLLPINTIKVGEKCRFSLKKFGFYVIDNGNLNKISKEKKVSLFSESDLHYCDIEGCENGGSNASFTVGDTETSNRFELILPKVKMLFEHIFSMLWIVVFIFELLIVVSVNFYLSTLSLQIEELSDLVTEKERKEVAYFWSTIFTFIIPFGSIFGVLEGVLIDKFGLWKPSLLPSLLFISCSILKLIPNLKFQVLTFIIYTTSQETIFSSIYSLFAIKIPTKIICTFVGVMLLLESLPVAYLSNSLVSLAIDYQWSFQEINTIIIIPTIVVTLIYVKFLYYLENKDSEKMIACK